MERFVFEFVFRMSLIGLTSAIMLRALRIRTAAAQHAVWAGVLMVMLVFPIWMFWGPKAALPVLPAQEESVTIVMNTSSPRVEITTPTSLMPLKIADSSEAQHFAWSWSTVWFGTYLLGASVLLLRLGIGTVRANRLTRASCVVPVTVGLLQPRVLLPDYSSEWPERQLDAVLTHERAHARRRDPLFQWLALFNRAVFWFHPLAWWLERRLSALAEEVCDVAVLERGHDPRDYSEFLLELARAVQRAGTRVNALGMAMPGNHLAYRIRKIIGGVCAPRISPIRMACLALGCIIPAIVFAASTLDPSTEILRLRPMGAWPLPQPPVLLDRVPALPLAPASTAAPVLIAQVPTLPQQPPAALGQGVPPTTGFDVISVKKNVSGEVNEITPPLKNGRLSFRNVTVQGFMSLAFYPLGFDRIKGLPNWTPIGSGERFDIEAITEERAVTQERYQELLQMVLVDRFQLKFHWEAHSEPVYLLVADKKGLKLKTTDPSSCLPVEPGVPPTPNGTSCGRQYSIRGTYRAGLHVEGIGMTMKTLAAVLSLFGRPVIDRTGHDGLVDIKLDFIPENRIANAPADAAPSIFDALPEQLGLRLQSATEPIDEVIVDHIERPSEN